MEESDYIHSLLLNFFNVTIVDSNPAIITNTIKRDEKLEVVKYEFNLKPIDINNIDKFIYDEFINYNMIEYDFKSKSFIGKLLKIKNYYNLSKIVENNDWVICGSVYYNFMRKFKTNIYLNDYFNDDIIVVGNNSDLILRINESIEYYLKSDNIKVYKLI